MKPAITIIGNIFVDIKGVAFGQEVYPDTKNVGRIQFTHGGAARNAVHNLALLGADARFLSSYTEDGTGADVITTLQEAGVDVSWMKSYPSQGMGRWLAILNRNGDLVCSISEQPLLAYQEETILSQLEACIADTRAVGLDIGISRQINEQVSDACEKMGIPLFALVGNLDVLIQDPFSLKGIHTFVCNLEEASILLQKQLHTLEETRSAVQELTRFGPARIVLTMAERGSLLYDKQTEELEFVPALPVQLVDSTGAGDSFFAGLMYAVSLGNSFKQAVACGNHVAANVIATEGSTLASSLPFDFQHEMK